MSITPAVWVPEAIRAYVIELESASHPLDDAEKSSMQRLISDDCMRPVYQNDYLNSRFTPLGWRIWFDCARGVDTEEIKAERARLKKHAALVMELDKHLAEVARLTEEIDELAAGEAGRPMVLYDPLALIETAANHPGGSRNGDLPHLFADCVKPDLDKLSRFDIGRYIPSVSHILATLSHEVFYYHYQLEEQGPVSSDPNMAAAMRKRDSLPLPEYVRFFDSAMQCYGAETGGDDFLMPPASMARQASVLLNLNTVTSSQITSARKSNFT